ncbi:hypothetical protein AV926_17520 [Myroides marinus]|uniref:MORN repeat variant n=1 Tax=Myroides marinus TaxID=703342 RepID=A0A163VKV0_9FLAO|nr:hypothetical protein [Myroides marinus]KZE75031.1 hypothetical protein AV926_17520 [Myroides marinus]
MKFRALLLLVYFITISVWSQERVNFNELRFEPYVSRYFTSTTSILFTGIAVVYYENGKVKEETTYVLGVKKGIQREYYDNGKLKIEKNYEYGKFVEEKKYCTRFGKMMMIPIYEDSVLEGDYKEYDEAGVLKVKRQYKNGKVVSD